MVYAAHLFYEQKKLKNEIADIISVSPSTATRLIKEALQCGIVKVSIEPPSLAYTQYVLKGTLCSSISDVVVTAGGDDKNSNNIGYAAATTLLDVLTTIEKGNEPIRIALACGQTICCMIRHFTNILSADKELLLKLKDKYFELYPTALFSDFEFNPIYPHSLVMSLAEQTKELLPNVRAFAPTLPTVFSQLTPTNKNIFLKQYGYDKQIQKAREADVIVLGIGTADDDNFKNLSSKIGVDYLNNKIDLNSPEINFTPFDSNGKPNPTYERLIVGISLHDLENISKKKGVYVMGLIGGTAKKEIAISALRNPKFNLLITDDIIAEEWLGTQLN